MLLSPSTTSGGLLVRAQQRHAIRRALPLACHVVRKGNGRRVGKRALDVSTDGMLLLSDADIAADDVLVVSFCATPFRLYFETEARVARIVHGRRPGDVGRSLGLSFEPFDALSRQILRGALRKVPPPLPRRAPRVDYAQTVRRIAESAKAPAIDAFYFHDAS